jgi:2-haloalkanoic acid dehalogenase type II
MNLDPRLVRALTFDCYGTLIDWDSGIRAYLRRLLDLKGARDVELERFYRHWYHQCELPAIAGPFMPYHEVLRTSVQRALRDFGLEVRPDDGADFGQDMKTWLPFPDTHRVLTELARRYPLCIVSNTTRDIIERSIAHMDVKFTHVVTAEDVGVYKPDRRIFEAALARLGLAPGPQVLHVFQSTIVDLPTAHRLGLQMAWINRNRETLEPELPRPDWIVLDLAPLLELLG